MKLLLSILALTGIAAAQPTSVFKPVPETRTVNGHALSGNVTVSKSDVGLGNVDNTSDAAKVASGPIADALATKAGWASVNTYSSSQIYNSDVTFNNWSIYGSGALFSYAPAAATSHRAALALTPGTNVQAYDADLSTWAGITPAAGFSAWLAGSPTSANFATLLSDENGTGKVIFSAGTLAVASGKTLTANNSITLSGTDGTTVTTPSTNATMARTDAAQTFTGAQTFNTPIAVASGGTGINAFGTGVATAMGQNTNTSSGFVTQSGGDSRYLPTYFLYDTTATTSVSHASYTTSATQVTLPAGTYQYSGLVGGSTASSSAGVTVLFTTLSGSGVMRIQNYRGTSFFGLTTMQASTLRADTNVDLAAAHTNDPSASDKFAVSTISGILVLGSQQTFGFKISQRTATDASNAATLMSGSHVIFTKIQ